MIMETPMMDDNDLAMLEDDMLVALDMGPDDDEDSGDLFDDEDEDFELDEFDSLEEFDDDFDDDDY